MSLFKKKKNDPADVPVADVVLNEEENDVAADVDAVMRKYDRESATRIWEGKPKLIIRSVMALFSVYCIYMTLCSTAIQEVRLSAFLGLVVLLGYMTYPAKKGCMRVNYIPWYDIVLMVVGSGCFFYYTLNAMSIIQKSVLIGKVEVILGIVGILVLMELCRRCVGVPILVVVSTLIAYCFLSGLNLRRVIYTLFYTTSGVIGTPISVCYKYIVLFIIFGAFLERTGIANFFLEVANRVAGWASGGPAKVAVIVSAMEGMVSGSSVANTVGSGSVNIPMMKKLGYKPEFAAAVEAAASTGGQIMPPIMGAAAFLMAEYMNLPYGQVAMKAILPAALYFAGIFIAVHLEAKKLGLKGMSKDQMPKISALVKQIYLLIPLVLLIWMVSSNTRTMQSAAAISILAAIVVGFINPKDRLTLGKVWEALEAGARSSVTVVVACGVAGMIAGCITVTGLASKLIAGVVAISGDATIIALILTMICCIVLGMGVPTTANFCIMATTCAPILIKMGFPDVAAYFFVFYFGIVADITPPVALAAYAGAAIAKANPMKTGVNATKLAIAAFIVPYIFAYSPAMLFENVSGAFQVVQICATSLIGIYGVAAAMNGYVYRQNNWLFRLAYLAGGLCLMVPETFTDLVGLAVVLGLTAVNRVAAKKADVLAA